MDHRFDAELAGDITVAVLQRYLATKHVLTYLNGTTWYALHPMARSWVHERAARLAAEAAAPQPTEPQPLAPQPPAPSTP